MGKKLIIAEKPSVALDISKALGGFTKHDDYYESDDYVLSSAVGHLLADHRVRAVGLLGTIQAAASHQAGQPGDADAKHLR